MTDDLINHLTHLLSDASPQPWRVDGDSRRRIAVGDVPDPLPIAQLERHREAMQRAVAEAFDVSWHVDDHGIKYRTLPSVGAVVDAMIAAVVAEMESRG